MPREILEQIINEKLIFDLIAILLVYFLVNWIIFRLYLQILGMPVKFQQLLPGILLMILFNVCGKQIFPNNLSLLYMLTALILHIVLVKTIVKNAVTWVKVFWAILLGMCASGVGVLTILTPLCSFNSAIYSFIMKTPLGIAVGTIIGEGLLPLIAYFILKTVDISIVPPVKRRVDLIDLGNLYIFAVPFGFLYSESMKMLRNIGISPISDLVKGYIYQLFIAVSLPIVYYFVYTNTKKRYMDIVQKLESEKDNLTEQLHNVIAFDRELDPQIKQIIVESFIKIAENQAAKTKKEQRPAFTINYSVMALLGLKERDAKVCGFLILNQSNKQIAEELILSAGHVSNTISEMIQKFGLSDRYELARFALNKQLVELTKE